MRLTTILALAAVAGVTTTAVAQDAPEARVRILSPGSSRFEYESSHRAALGIGTTTTGTLRDTLGILITSVTKGSPAEKAGLEEGNRIAAINGVSLRASAADVDDADMSNALTRRLTRELGKVKAGDEVELKLYREGKAQTVKIKTADSDELFRPSSVGVSRTREDAANRPVLGLSLGSTGSRRDTLGVLVMSVTDSGPAARAGLEEGNRIAAINGVNLRVSRDDAGDQYLASSKVTRLQREISALKPGDNVTLSVYSNGRTRDVTMKVARAGDLPKGSGSMFMFGDHFMGSMAPMPAMPAMPPMTPMAPMSPMRSRTPTPARPPSVYRYEVTPEIRERLEEARTRVESIRPQLERALQGSRSTVRVQSVRPVIAPRVRIVHVVL